jgi:hypothetical protein
MAGSITRPLPARKALGDAPAGRLGRLQPAGQGLRVVAPSAIHAATAGDGLWATSNSLLDGENSS